MSMRGKADMESGRKRPFLKRRWLVLDRGMRLVAVRLPYGEDMQRRAGSPRIFRAGGRPQKTV